ncbi:MAG: aspartate/glutamate racemase family protein [Synergistota bacterium]|nr:aspartate/glutamate racemase family protein [Synergistota bacterium]
MKTIGIIGGLAWQSSAELYRMINELVNKKLGGQHSCKCVMYSVDLDPILILRDEEKWDELANIIEDAIRRVEAAGADFTVIVSNTMHKTVDVIKDRVSKPILHIADVTAQAILDRGFKTVGLMGTKFTLTQDFYKAKMERDYGIKILVPDEDDIAFIHHVIYEELDFSIFSPESSKRFVEIIEKMGSRGAEGVILGCTEIPLLVKQEQTNIPLFDTTTLLAEAAVKEALVE